MNKQNVFDFSEFTNTNKLRKWNELSEVQRKTLLNMISDCIDARDGSTAKLGCECIVDFTNGLSVSGIMTEDGVVIDDNSAIYDPTVTI